MTEIARFRIGETVYSTAALDEISLRDLMLFDSQAADMGLHVRWADVQRIGEEMANADEETVEAHPDALLVTGVTIWASRRAAGENVTLEQAVDFPLSQLEFLPPTQDHAPANPTQPRQAKKGGGRAIRAVEQPADGDGSTTSETSAQRSASA